MTESFNLPLWLVLLGGLLAAWAVIDRLLLPSVRWFFRRRVNLVITEINERLDLQLPAFKLTKRRVLIDRLVYDPEVLEAADAYCRAENVPREVALEKVERYAREIVPAFNAYFYFRLGSWLSKSIARLLYRVRLGYTDEQRLAEVDPRASVVFVMNHRSNMDYILVAYLALNRVALSYAVGEWARVWPIQQLVRATGAYFVRRGSANPLYRKVLARYVQMAASGGVVQAIFPEGGLSRDGRLREPKIGLLKYMLEGFDPNGERDLVFIPLAINYDRVLEDRTLLRDRNPGASRPSRLFVIRTTLAFIRRNIWLMLRGGWYRFGYAAANFGTPLSIRDYTQTKGIDFRQGDKDSRIQKIQELARELMASVGQAIPVLPVSLVSFVFAEKPEEAVSHQELRERARQLIQALKDRGAHVHIPRQDLEYAVKVGLRMLRLRHLVLDEGQLLRVAPGEEAMLLYYANAITHFIPLDGLPAHGLPTARSGKAEAQSEPAIPRVA